MAKRLKAFILRKVKAEPSVPRYQIIADSVVGVDAIEGVLSCNFFYRNYWLVDIDPRYDENEVVEEIETQLMTNAAIKMALEE